MAKVCVIGGAGGIGQPTCLLLKMNRNVGHLAVFDLVGAPGVAADLSHIDSPAKVTGHGMSLAQFTGPKKIANQDEYSMPRVYAPVVRLSDRWRAGTRLPQSARPSLAATSSSSPLGCRASQVLGVPASARPLISISLVRAALKAEPVLGVQA